MNDRPSGATLQTRARSSTGLPANPGCRAGLARQSRPQAPRDQTVGSLPWSPSLRVFPHEGDSLAYTPSHRKPSWSLSWGWRPLAGSRTLTLGHSPLPQTSLTEGAHCAHLLTHVLSRGPPSKPTRQLPSSQPLHHEDTEADKEPRGTGRAPALPGTNPQEVQLIVTPSGQRRARPRRGGPETKAGGVSAARFTSPDGAEGRDVPRSPSPPWP